MDSKIDNKNNVDIKKALDEQVKLFKKHQDYNSNKNKELEKERVGTKIRCTTCKQMFQSLRLENTCPACADLEKSRYQQLRDYLYSHPGTHIDVICDKFNVSRDTVRKYLREYRLEIVDGENNYFLLCQRCKEPIASGMYCDKCEPLANKQSTAKQQKTVTDFHSKR